MHIVCLHERKSAEPGKSFSTALRTTLFAPAPFQPAHLRPARLPLRRLSPHQNAAPVDRHPLPRLELSPGRIE